MKQTSIGPGAALPSRSNVARSGTTRSDTTRAAAVVGDPRWSQLVSRDAAADKTFFYAVETTGVYCRPSCAARTPRPENVSFHASGAEARRAGFRPCLRCRPDEPPAAERNALRIAALCRFIEGAEQAPSLQDLAEHAGLGAHHLHRMFKAATGLTPRAYAAAHRAARVRVELAASGSVTDAFLGAGYGSSGRFYAESSRVLGMTPTLLRRGAADVVIHFAIGACSLGAILVARSERGVCAITLGDDPDALARDLQDRFPRATLVGGDAGFERVVATVVGHVEAPGPALDLPLDLRGTLFQRRVWQELQAIPPGSTATYTDIAERIGAPRAVRAVAGACAANALAVAIPCHRVVRIDGSLSGYRWGVERKRALLHRERATP